MAASIEFIGVCKSYGDVRVLDNFSLVIPENITTALVGESGSGKSTLMMMSNGLVMPDTGSVTVLGEEVDQDTAISLRRRTGYAVQGGGLFPHLSIYANVTLMARLLGWPEKDCRTRQESLFEMLNLDPDLSERYPHSLSGGQQQRASLCRAMMLDPTLLLLDEPFSALDPLTRQAIHEEFLRLRDLTARTILLVTHDMQEAMRLAQHLIILKEGRVVQEGGVDDIARYPTNDYVTRLLS